MRRGLVWRRATTSSSERRPSDTAVSSSGNIVSRPGKPGGGVADCFSSLVCGAWCDEKTSMMSMFSHSASTSLSVASRGRTSAMPLGSVATCASVRKRWCGATPHVTLAPRRFASRTTMISSRRDSAQTWIARSYIMAIMSTAASVLDSARTTIGSFEGHASKCAIHTVRSSICSSSVVAWSSSMHSATAPLSQHFLAAETLDMVAPTYRP
mmetsp:Transcript_41137/g.96718  ORF Transcript_41137/g.96718 Transcript_41137/m.96718 type:complete len:211 (+) Transcript_41137:1624-2256(+)